ncbi:MAG: hypothetical protein JJU00_18135 [Opitutales bacterium]|nr:hypothetical protein [Opitutales bacterium]
MQGWCRQREYWSFYWPLTLTGLAMLLANQVQNGVLARYPDAAKELTTFALAVSFHAFLHAALVFVPQMANVYGRSRVSVRACFAFTARAGALLSLPLLILGWTRAGLVLPQRIFGVDDGMAETMQLYFRLLAPTVFLDGLRHALTGLLIQARRTGVVTVLNVGFLAVVLGLLFYGFRAGFPAVWTVGIAQLGGSLAALAATGFLWSRLYLAHEDDVPPPSQRELWAYFWPVALTSVCFALSRPVIFFFAAWAPDAFVLIAALRVAFDFSMLFFNPVNQFRHVMVTFGLRDVSGIGRFMLVVVLVLSGLLLLSGLTPAGAWVFAVIFGLDGQVLEYAAAALLPLALVPLAMGLRNWQHGKALLRKTTRRMGVSAVARVAVIAVASWAMVSLGWLGPRTGALLLAFGFLAEAASMWLIARLHPYQSAEAERAS